MKILSPMKQHFHFIFAASAMLLVLASCSRDNDNYQPSHEEIMANAEERLGIKIDPSMDWNMTAQAIARITVNGNYGETYTVKIYSNDPLVDKKGYVLKRGQVESGGTFETDFEYPASAEYLVVGITDSHSFTSYKSARVVGGLLETTFGGDGIAGARTMRSMSTPAVAQIKQPYDEAWVASYLETAKEPNNENVNDNYDNRYWVGASEPQWVVDQQASVVLPSIGNYQWGTIPQTIINGGDNYWENNIQYFITAEDRAWFNENCTPLTNFNWNGFDWNSYDHRAAYVSLVLNLKNKCDDSGRSNWLTLSGEWNLGSKTEEVGHWTEGSDGYWQEDETFVTKFKITDTYNGIINVATSEGYAISYYDETGSPVYVDKLEPFLARTIVVTGTWNITANQRIGSGGLIVIANGGTVNLADSTVTLETVNHARLVVLPGGKLTGNGTVLVANGNGIGEENYNGGTINVGTFNNNFGKFYNYGEFRAKVYAANAKESNFYNHSLAHIKTTRITNQDGGYYYVSPNARIFNACQWFCEEHMRAKIIENVQGSYFYVGGDLEMGFSEDHTTDQSYVSLANGSLMRIGQLFNNGCSWLGPTNGTAVVEIGRVVFLNWEGDGPIQKGYFANNIAITVDKKDYICTQGKAQGKNSYEQFRDVVANGKGTNGNRNDVGNGGVNFVEQFGASVIVPRDTAFVAGEKGCTPGYQGVGGGYVEEQEEEEVTPDPDPENPTESNVDNDDVPAVWTYAFEDTPLGDYDMNDVVIKVREHASDPTKLEVTLCCAGASFDLRVRLGKDTILFDKKEVHEVLDRPHGSLVNTGQGEEQTYLQPTYIDKPANFSFATADFWIESPLVADGVHIAKKGEDPHGIVIPGDWLWPREWVNIKDAYPNFIEFAKDVEKANEDDNVKKWYITTDTNPVRDKVFVPANSNGQ